MNCATTVFTTPAGEMFLAVDENGAILRLEFLTGRTAAGLCDELRRQGFEPRTDPAACKAAVKQIEAYFRGERRTFDLELAPRGTEFQQRVWNELRRIPYGETITYGELARRIGEPNGSRAVGRANGSNPIAVVVPCHRVIGADGSLTGYASGVDIKRQLLELEGYLPAELALG